ncbi:hypothetical protein [Amycolatopsis sp. H20-H5]|uniref:hypothetical protein n=1 Tax=Amycolatopsis sp. H20-H5 TaxID=3046309 RepID=UPI002DB593C6|nr:hypothetical protein [Amycolatopsis sp. H20-H5]MEC3973776.1 hypothetical protein [Amycolatopsis sp. H20-H5]
MDRTARIDRPDNNRGVLMQPKGAEPTPAESEQAETERLLCGITQWLILAWRKKPKLSWAEIVEWFHREYGAEPPLPPACIALLQYYTGAKPTSARDLEGDPSLVANAIAKTAAAIAAEDRNKQPQVPPPDLNLHLGVEDEDFETEDLRAAFLSEAAEAVGQRCSQDLLYGAACQQLYGSTLLPGTLAEALEDEHWLALLTEDLRLHSSDADCSLHHMLHYIVARWGGRTEPTEILRLYVEDADTLGLRWSRDAGEVTREVYATIEDPEAHAGTTDEREIIERILSRFDRDALDQVGAWYEQQFLVRMQWIGAIAENYRGRI